MVSAESKDIRPKVNTELMQHKLSDMREILMLATVKGKGAYIPDDY